MYIKRIENLQNQLALLHLDAFLVEDPLNLFYLTGLSLSLGKLLVLQKKAFLFVDGRYIENAKKHSPVSVVLLEKNSFENTLKSLFGDSFFSLGFNKELTSFAAFEALKKSFSSFSIELIPTENLVATLREIKEPYEIEMLSKAALLGSEGFDFVCSFLKEGVTEEEVALELEIFWKRKKAKGLAFDPIIAFGKNSSMPHYRASTTSLKQGDTVLIDIGVNLNHYHSDMTRVVFFGKAKEPQILTIYEIVLEAQKRALNTLKDGVLIEEVDKAARNYIEEKGFGDYFNHSLGHGVGLEIHESPSIRKTPLIKNSLLKKGMVVTIEPGIYLPDMGGVRIEDTVVITENGYLDLTKRNKEILHV